MNERERFRLLFRGAAVDRPPLLEEGVRDGVLEAWHAQGLPPGKTHLDIFGLTPHENIGPDIKPIADGSVPLVSMSTRDYRRAFRVTRGRFPEDWRKTAKRLENRNHIVCLWASRGFFQALGVKSLTLFWRRGATYPLPEVESEKMFAGRPTRAIARS
jgi:hypothetical protein